MAAVFMSTQHLSTVYAALTLEQHQGHCIEWSECFLCTINWNLMVLLYTQVHRANNHNSKADGSESCRLHRRRSVQYSKEGLDGERKARRVFIFIIAGTERWLCNTLKPLVVCWTLKCQKVPFSSPLASSKLVFIPPLHLHLIYLA